MAEPIRVLHVMNDLRVGGGQQLVLNMMRSMDPERVRPGLAYLEPADEMTDVFRAAGFEPVPLNRADRTDGPAALRRLVGLIRRERIDVLHAHSSIDKHYALIAGFLARVPVIIHLHMPHDYEAEAATLGGRVRAAIRAATFRLAANHYVAVSNDVYSAHADHLKAGSVSYIPNGIPLERFTGDVDPESVRALRIELGIGDASPILINVGALRGHKNQRVLPAMMALVRQGFPDARLLIVGEGDERASIEREIKDQDVEDSVTILGTRQDVGALLSLADLFVFPSHAEGYGLALAEAMAAGLPSVASNLAVHAELIEQGVTGSLVEATPERLASAVVDILNDPSRARSMGKEAQRIARERCDLEVTARAVTEVYEQVAARRR
jgi:glycosyltransferase involved in cell wall biosynthesis